METTVLLGPWPFVAWATVRWVLATCILQQGDHTCQDSGTCRALSFLLDLFFWGAGPNLAIAVLFHCYCLLCSPLFTCAAEVCAVWGCWADVKQLARQRSAQEGKLK